MFPSVFSYSLNISMMVFLPAVIAPSVPSSQVFGVVFLFAIFSALPYILTVICCCKLITYLSAVDQPNWLKHWNNQALHVVSLMQFVLGNRSVFYSRKKERCQRTVCVREYGLVYSTTYQALFCTTVFGLTLCLFVGW